MYYYSSYLTVVIGTTPDGKSIKLNSICIEIAGTVVYLLPPCLNAGVY